MVYDAGMTDPAVATLLAGAFALLFASAALHKFRDLAVFAQLLAAYRLLPERVNVAPLVPLAEVAVAAGLLVPATRAAAALGGAALLLLYAAALGVNLARGRRDLSCGCGGASERRPIAPWMVVRNLACAALLTTLALPVGTRPLEAVDALTIAAGVAVAGFLYTAADLLLGRIRPRGLAMRGPR